MRKGEQAREKMVKDVNGQILREGVEVRRRWAEYFGQVLNVADVREANINAVGNWRMPVPEDLNERAISLEEVVEAVNEMKSGKAPGLDGFPVECLKKGGTAVFEWLVRLLNLSFDMWVVCMGWRGACIMPLYKWKGDKCECSNSRGISFLSVVGKLFGRVLIKKVRAETECAIGEEQYGFRQGRGCMDQVFAVRQVCEMVKIYSGLLWIWKRPMTLTIVILCFICYGVYGVGGKLLKAVQSFYVDSRACVRVGNDVSEWFPVNVGLRKGCVMSPWLFNVYMDGVVQEVNVRVLGNGLELLSANGVRFEKNQLLFADDTALVADSEEKLCRLVNEFGRVCERRKLRVNVGKSKAMRFPTYGNLDRMQVVANGGCERDVIQRMNEGYRAWGVLKSVLSNK